MEAEVATVVGLDNQPVRRDRGDCAVVVQISLVDVALAIARNAIVTAIRSHKPAASRPINSKLTNHRTVSR
jgi:hypothetical protein